jgi:hypothetical protein
VAPSHGTWGFPEPADRELACGEPFGSGSGGVGGTAQETGRKLEILVFVRGAGLRRPASHVLPAMPRKTTSARLS